MKMFIRAAALIVLSLVLSDARHSAQAQVLVGNPFITSYENWIDPLTARGGNWRLSLHQPTVMETSDIVPAGNNPPAATNNGSYVPTLLIQDAFVSPTSYDFNARMYSVDDDGFGLVFGYQDSDNYFRALLRAQANGNLGGTTGVSVQKVVNGVATQISPAGTGPGTAWDPTFALIDSRSPLDVRVHVNGPRYDVFVAGINNDMPLAGGSDPDLMAGKIGIQSWAQRNRVGANPHWGTEVESVSVSNNAGVLYSGAFNNLPVPWRAVEMRNSDLVRTHQHEAPIVGDDRGNFGADVNDGWIYQQTNGFEWATQTAPNVDFIGPAVLVNEVPASNNYEMRVRLGARDDDGLGVLVRVLESGVNVLPPADHRVTPESFYRINFANQSMAATNAWERAPRGMSVQKFQFGGWTELFRDDQNNPLFVYTPGAAGSTPATGMPMFDLSVKAVGNTLAIQAIDHLGNVIDYPLIVDNDNPLLLGRRVGLHTWGNEHVYFMNYGGVPGPLVVVIPEPATIVLALAASIGALARGRRFVRVRCA